MDEPRRTLRIALMGTRGAPARYGGFETAVDEVGRRLASRGHTVTVYCRTPPGVSRTPEYGGMRLVHLPSVPTKSLETLSHTGVSTLHALLHHRHDVAFVFNSANSPFVPFLQWRGMPVAVHVDGLEWQRGKWGRLGRGYYRRAEQLGVRRADALIADAPGIVDYYAKEFGAPTDHISYGAPVLHDIGDDRLSELGVASRRFHLVVARMEPENQVEMIVRGYRASNAVFPLVVVGSAPYAHEYTRIVQSLADTDPRIVLAGAVWDQQVLDQLYGHCLLHLHGHSIGGTNPSLLRSAGAGAAIAAYDVRFNRDVIGDEAMYFDDEKSVVGCVEQAEAEPETMRRLGATLQARIADHYHWDTVAAQYEDLALRLASGASQRGVANGRRAGQW